MFRRVATTAIAALGAVCSWAPPVRAGGCSYSLGSYLNGFMPDFDQRRTPGPLFWNGSEFVNVPAGLPGNGANYCSPTSHTNVMAYLASHGFPGLMPGGGVPQSWGAQGQYERVTANIFEMGQFMETDPNNGTTCCGYSGCVEYLDDKAPGKFIVSDQVADGFYAPPIGDLAFCGIAGGFVSVMIGWFEDTGVNQWQKTGGHVVTMVGLEGWCGGQRKIKIRDPGNDSAVQTEQSVFANNSYTLQQLPGFFDSDGTNNLNVYFQRTYERMLGYNASDGRIGLINGYRVVVPKYGVTLTPPPQQEVTFLNPIRPTHSTIPAQFGWAIAGIDQVTGMAIGADYPNVYCVGRLASGARDSRVFRLNAATGESDVVFTGAEPRAVVAMRHRMFAIIDRTQLIMVRDSVPTVITNSLFAEEETIARCDDLTDSLIVLAPVARKLAVFDGMNIGAAPVVHSLPSALALNGEAYMSVSPLDGSVWIRSRNSASAYKVKLDAAQGAVIEETVNLPGTVGDIGIDVSVEQTREHVLLARQVGTVAEFSKNPTNGQWEAVTGSSFAGLPAYGGIELARSRSGFDEATMDGPNNHEQLPGGHSAPEWDCPGDVDLDGEVAFSDITQVLIRYGSTDEHPADVDGSGSVGFSDLTGALVNWGPCD